MTSEESNFLYSGNRWEGFEFRDGDVVISTPPKCGTTWTQRILSLLVFDSPDLYAPLARLSPWVDMNTRPLDEVRAELAAQTHRRFMKSHLPLDYLPQDDRVTYVSVGRDPRDVGLSWMHHTNNVDMEKLVVERINAVGMDDLADMSPDDVPDFSGTIADRFWRWVDSESFDGLAHTVAHLQSFWDRRDDPNVVLLHYADMQRDLPGQMQFLAQRLGIDASDARIEELAPHATFAEMKAAASNVVPNSDQTFFKSFEGFFHSGETGQWHEVLGDDLPRYDKRIGELAEGDFADWLHRGS